MQLRANLLMFECAVRAYQASNDFLKYLQGENLDNVSYDAKDVALKHFLYPLLQMAGDEETREGIREEINRIQQAMGGG